MKRRGGVVLMFGAVLPLAVASVAWACANLATATLSKGVAAPGDSLTITGKGYSGHGGASTVGDTDVTLTLAGRKGIRLGTASVDSSGRINETVRVPAGVSPGWYTVVATQFAADGTPKPGTPGRARLRIQGSSAAAAVVPFGSATPAAPAAISLSARDDAGMSGQTLLLWTGLSLTLLAAGWLLVSGRWNQTPSRRTLGV